MKFFIINILFLTTIIFAIQPRIVPLSYLKTEFFINEELGSVIVDAHFSRQGKLERFEIRAFKHFILLSQLELNYFSEIQVNSFSVVGGSLHPLTGKYYYSIVFGQSSGKNGAIWLYLDGTYELRVFKAIKRKELFDSPNIVKEEKSVVPSTKKRNIDSLLHHLSLSSSSQRSSP